MITGQVVKSLGLEKVHAKEIVVEKDGCSYDFITGYVIKNIELNGISFLLISINLFVITAIALFIGFHISRHHKT